MEKNTRCKIGKVTPKKGLSLIPRDPKSDAVHHIYGVGSQVTIRFYDSKEMTNAEALHALTCATYALMSV